MASVDQILAAPWPRLITPPAKKKAAPKSKPRPYDPNSTSPVDQMTVGNETVEAAEIWAERPRELDAMKASASSSDGLRGMIEERSVQLITDKIAEMLLYQRASLRLDPADEKKVEAVVDAEIRKIVTSEFGGVQRKFEKDLQSRGRSIEDARLSIRRKFIIAAFLDGEVKPKIPEPTRAELMNAYQKNRDSWRKPARRSMSLIDIRVRELLPEGTENPTQEELVGARVAARKKAAQAHADLLAGKSFADVARDFSHDGRAMEGGRWGSVNRESVRERFYPALDGLDRLREGEISGVIEAPEDFFIVRCDELESSVEPDFQTAQPQLREYLFNAAYNQKIVEYVTDLRKGTKIEPARLERFHAAVVVAALDTAPTAAR